jgi:hypothetical protein
MKIMDPEHDRFGSFDNGKAKKVPRELKLINFELKNSHVETARRQKVFTSNWKNLGQTKSISAFLISNLY